MNVLTFSGNLGSDAEMKATPSGTMVCQFSVAMRSGYKDREVTHWVRCSMFGERGEAIAPYLKTGGLVAVSGELSLHQWTNKDGENKASLEVKVNNVTLLGGGREDHKPAAATRPPARKERAPVPQPMTFDDSDIPFNNHEYRMLV